MIKRALLCTYDRDDREVLVRLKDKSYFEIIRGEHLQALFKTTDYKNDCNNAFWIRFT